MESLPDNAKNKLPTPNLKRTHDSMFDSEGGDFLYSQELNYLHIWRFYIW